MQINYVRCFIPSNVVNGNDRKLMAEFVFSTTVFGFAFTLVK